MIIPGAQIRDFEVICYAGRSATAGDAYWMIRCLTCGDMIRRRRWAIARYANGLRDMHCRHRKTQNIDRARRIQHRNSPSESWRTMMSHWREFNRHQQETSATDLDEYLFDMRGERRCGALVDEPTIQRQRPCWAPVSFERHQPKGQSAVDNE